MNIKRVTKYIGSMITLEGICMFLPFIVSLLYKEETGFYFFIFAITLIVIGEILKKLFKADERFYSAEGFVTVALGWVVLSIMGALPFYFSKVIPNYIDALFEVVSGFSTTGATILNDVSVIPKCMNFWRSFTHFVGGMGVLVLVLALLPTQSENMLIMKAESPGPQVGKLVPKVSDTAKTLYLIYIFLTLVTIISYKISGMPLYDSICIGFGTAGTGGFVVTKGGCADYSLLSQTLITLFMLVFGVNFNLYYLVTIGKIKDAVKSEELKVYLLIILISIGLIFVNIFDVYASKELSFHNACFQVASIITTTGYAVCDYTIWPMFSRCILVFLMIVGGCAGSTGGGFKVSRLIINFKACINEIYLQLHPNSVRVVKFEGKHVNSTIVHSVFAYTLIYIIIIIGGILLISFENFDFETTFSSVIETFNNIGLGLSKIGPNGNFSIFNAKSKLVFIILMLTGRLEIFPMILLFSRNTWKRSI